MIISLIEELTYNDMNDINVYHYEPYEIVIYSKAIIPTKTINNNDKPEVLKTNINTISGYRLLLSNITNEAINIIRQFYVIHNIQPIDLPFGLCIWVYIYEKNKVS